MALAVLVAVDLSPADERLVAWLARLQAQLREPARVTLMHVVAVGTASTQVPFGDALELEHREAEAALARYGVGEVRVELGSPGRTIAEASTGYDLLVVGGGDRTALGEALLGSTSQYLTHHARCPVLVVRPA